jgi:hypothetical protein
MAGLPAAGVLADFFEHVVVVERDILPLDASHRTGTPQARHTHALLAGGQRALGELFPGFEQDLAGAGAVPLSVGLDLRLERPGYDPFPARDLNLVAKAMSRPLIEFTLRQRGFRDRQRPLCRAGGNWSSCPIPDLASLIGESGRRWKTDLRGGLQLSRKRLLRAPLWIPRRRLVPRTSAASPRQGSRGGWTSSKPAAFPASRPSRYQSTLW